MLKEIKSKEFINKDIHGEKLNISGKNTYTLVAKCSTKNGKKFSCVICECREINLDNSVDEE